MIEKLLTVFVVIVSIVAFHIYKPEKKKGEILPCSNVSSADTRDTLSSLK